MRLPAIAPPEIESWKIDDPANNCPWSAEMVMSPY